MLRLLGKQYLDLIWKWELQKGIGKKWGQGYGKALVLHAAYSGLSLASYLVLEQALNIPGVPPK